MTRSSRRSAITWTSQLFVLGDFGNVAAQDPNWADDYTDNKAKYVDQPALQGFKQPAADPRRRPLQQGLRLGDLPDGDQGHRHRHRGALPDADRRALDRRSSTTRTTSTTSASSRCRLRTRRTPRRRSGARTRSTSRRRPTGAKLDAAKKFIAWVNSSAGCAMQNKVCSVARTVRDQLLHAAGQRAAGRQGHAAYLKENKSAPLWSSSPRSRARTWRTSPSRSARASRPPSRVRRVR